jgi:hypothetical protein
VNDAERLAQDAAFRLMGSERIWERGAALTSRLQSFETELLTQEENLARLAATNREMIVRGEAIDSPQRGAGHGFDRHPGVTGVNHSFLSCCLIQECYRTKLTLFGLVSY